MNSPTYLIVGCGYFGSRAAEKLLRKDPKPKIIVVDRNKEAVKKVSNLPAETFTGDGPVYLGEFFSEGRSTDYIIPAIPFHLVFEFILSQLKTWGAKKKRIPPLPGLPNPIVGKTGDLYTSLSDFLCSEDCPEPTRYCTATGKRRAKPLYQILKDLGGPFESKVIRSRPLELGVGGFRPEVLIDLLEDMKEKIEPGRSILNSTASRCHGVTSALSF